MSDTTERRPSPPEGGLTRRHIDFVLKDRGVACGHEDQTMYFHSRCHPDEPTWSYYDRDKGTVTVECAMCRNTILTIQVAPE